MRIAYIAPYQGSALLKSRPILRNLGLAANVKMELIGGLLAGKGHEVELFSQGEVVERNIRLYRGFDESERFHADVPVSYASALPVRFVNGFWSTHHTLELFKRRHRVCPFDVALIYNLREPQVACAQYAMRRLGIPTILEFEDDVFVDVFGRNETGLLRRWRLNSARKVLASTSGCIGVSPHLLSHVPQGTSKMLLRGVVDDAVWKAGRRPLEERKNWVVYAGTHYRSKGLEPLIAAWKSIDLPGWELHIAGLGELTSRLKKMAEGRRNIVFRGLIERRDYAEFISTGKIGMNPHEVSSTPGNVFAFKIVEYLAAGNHVITTPMGVLEPGVEEGLTYMPDNRAETISDTLKRVIFGLQYERKAREEALELYGFSAVGELLDSLIRSVVQDRPGTSRRGEKWRSCPVTPLNRVSRSGWKEIGR